MVFSREGVKGVVVCVFLALNDGRCDFSPAGSRASANFSRYSPGRWLSGILHQFLFRILSLEGLRWESPPSPAVPAFSSLANKALLARLNQFICDSMASRYAFPLMLYIEGYSFWKIAEVLETSPGKVLLRIQKGKRILLGKLETEKAEACFN